MMTEIATAPEPTKTAPASLFPPFDPTHRYFNLCGALDAERVYQSQMIESAIRSDSVPAIDEAITRGWLAPECRAFDNAPVVDYAELRGATAVAAYLRELGWPEGRA